MMAVIRNIADIAFQVSEPDAMLEHWLNRNQGNYRFCRKLMLLGVFRSAFELKCKLSATPQTAEGSAKAFLEMSAWDLHAQLSHLKEVELEPQLRPLKRSMERWAGLLLDTADERRMEAWLPAVTTRKDQAEEYDSRKAALLQVAFEAGKAGQQGQRQMRQALSLAKRYGVTPMPIHFAYLKALLTQTKGSLEPLHDLIAASYDQLATKPQDLIRALYEEVLQPLDSKEHNKAAYCLQLMSQCAQGSSSEAFLAASSFTTDASQLLPDLNTQKLVAPLVSKAMQPFGEVSGASEAKKAASEGAISAEIAEQISIPTVKEFAALIRKLQAAAEGIATASELWPSGSVLRLLAFCKEMIVKGKGRSLLDRYKLAEPLLHEMDVKEVVQAGEWFGVGRDTPFGKILHLREEIPHDLYLRHLQLCCQLVKGHNVNPDSVQRLQAEADKLQRTLDASKAAGLERESEDLILSCLSRDPEGGVVKACARLFNNACSLQEVEAAAKSLLAASSSRRDVQQLLLEAMADAVRLAMSTIEGTQSLDAATFKSGWSKVLRHNAIYSTIECLSGPNQAAAKPLRDLVWSMLQRYVLQKKPDPDRSLIIQLLAEFSSEDPQICRWPGWKPAQRGAISTSTTQLWIQSMTLLESHWQEAELKPQDVETLAAAKIWFLHAVVQSNSRAALQGLGQLLAGPWDHGSVWHTPQVSGKEKDLPASAAQKRDQKRGLEGRVGERYPMQDAEAGTEADGWDVALPEELSTTLEGLQISHQGSDGTDNATAGEEARDGDRASSADSSTAKKGNAAADNETEVALLHGCWRILMERQLRLGFFDLTLKVLERAAHPLLTATESTTLVQMAYKEDFAFATAFSLLLPLPELQDAAKKQLAERSQNLQLQSCPALMTLLVSKNLLPGLVSSACFPQICKQLLDNTNGMKIRRDIEFPAALAQLVLSQNMEIAAALMTRHLRIHPILRNYGNGLMLLPRYFKSRIREVALLELPVDQLLDSHFRALKLLLPSLYRSALNALE